MNYVSFLFLLYVTVTCGAYFLYPVIFRRHRQYQWIILLAASWGFYAICSGWYLALLLGTSLLIYLGALALQKLAGEQKSALKGRTESVKLTREEKKAIRQKFTKRRRIVLWTTLLISFGILAFFKYIPGLVSGLTQGRQTLSLLIPVGISFYTFQATGYLIDVYNGNVQAERNYLKVALFISFFPQIIQGPIGFWDPVAGQLFEEHQLEWNRFKHGFELILWGYLRKMVLADRIVNDIYLVTDSYAQYSGSMIALAVLLYAIQLYADFAGGIDISRGIAEILGITLPENFRQPYLATSINDYWRRWHITLGAWMKKYIFYPLALTPLFSGAGKRLGKTSFGRTDFGRHAAKVLPASLSCIVVFLVVGIWHGAGWRYVAFGLWNGGLIFLSMMLEPLFPAWKKAVKRMLRPESGCRTGVENLKCEEALSDAGAIGENSAAVKKVAQDENAAVANRKGKGINWYRIFQILRTFLLIYIGYVFDVAQDFCSAMEMMIRMITHFQWNPIALYGELCSTYTDFNNWNVMIILCMTALMIIVDHYHERHDHHLGGDGLRLRDYIDRGSFWKEWILVTLCVCAIVLLGIYGPGYDPVKFVYANF